MLPQYAMHSCHDAAPSSSSSSPSASSSSSLCVHPCREFVTALMLRRPRDRMLSHMRNVLATYYDQYGAFSVSRGLFEKHFKPDSAADWLRLATPVVDNYLMRSLVGSR